MTFKEFFKYYSWTAIVWGAVSAIASGIAFLGIKALAKSYDEEHEAEKTQDLN